MIIIKCYKCGKKFQGNSLSEVIKEFQLKQTGKYYSCDCKDIINDFLKKEDKEDSGKIKISKKKTKIEKESDREKKRKEIEEGFFDADIQG